MQPDDARRMLTLIHQQRWAGLATCQDNVPLASMVAFATCRDDSGFLLHLSGLAAHTRYLLEVGRGSLAISGTDSGDGDPQQIPRISVSGPVARLDPADVEYAACKLAYLAKLPDAEPRFGFGDFHLFLLRPEKVGYVGGFANARNLTEAGYLAAVRSAAQLPG